MSDAPAPRLTHTDADGQAKMVNVGAKPSTDRLAVACATIVMAPETLRLIRDNQLAKGDVLGVARLAGIMGAKRTADLIPLCHPLGLDHVDIDLQLADDPPRIEIRATASCHGKTGVEMEALTAATVTALTVYDMAKAVDRGMTIENVGLIEKKGGKSGHWRR
ncbi:MAG: cyclic pyranopterin phosphate synthase [Myxococcota bacterium]